MNAQAHAGSENCLPIGTRLADFEITGILGEGGFGIVYIAFDHSLQRTVAIKEYMPGVLATRGEDHGIRVRADRHQETFNVGLKSFINEARFLAQFDHPSLVKVYRFWEQNQTAYTAMQYYDGRTMKDIVASSPELVTEAWCRKVLKQILEALEMLYTMRILHRDVSPDNIIVADNGDAVLLDFGSARQIIGDRTRGLTVILKPGYAPVEQYAGDASLDQGPYTDIYALAAVIYYAIMREAPATSIARMVKDPIVPLAVRGVEGFSTPFLAAIDKGLAVMAHERPQTIDAFRELLGIESSGAPRARTGNTQRFATLDLMPQPSAAPLPGSTPPVPPTGRLQPAAAPLAPAARQNDAATDKIKDKNKDRTAAPAVPRTHVQARIAPKPGAKKTVPRWAGYVATAAMLLVISAFGAKWLLDTPGDIIMPVAEHGDEVQLPDASAAPAPAVPAPPAPLQSDPAALAAVADIQPAPDTVVETAPVITEPIAEVPETATYRLSIRPWGTVYVDGQEQGVSPPMKKMVIAAGKHTIRIVNPSFPDYVIDVNLSKGKMGTIEHQFVTNSK